jgi:hypothetical protein
MTELVSPIEIIYRQLKAPSQLQPVARVVDESKPLFTRDDVSAIIHRQRSSTPDELQFIIDHAVQFELTDGERNQIACDLTIAMSARARQVSGRREDASAKLIAELGYAETPCGSLPERDWFQTELETGTKAITACQRHLPPQCACWRRTREALYDARLSFGERSPQSWAALRVWEAMEELEVSARPDRGWHPVLSAQSARVETKGDWITAETSHSAQ